jgi:hypothetical protein
MCISSDLQWNVYNLLLCYIYLLGDDSFAKCREFLYCVFHMGLL